MSNPQQPATKMWSGRFREPADREPARWPLLLLCIALPFYPLMRVIELNTDIIWTPTLFLATACVVLLFFRTSVITHTSLTRATFRMYLLCLGLSLLWFGLNQIRVATYDNAVEGQTGTAAKLYWFVTERAQPTTQWCIAACAAGFVTTGIYAAGRIVVRRLKSTHV